MLSLPARLPHLSLAALRLVGVGGTLGISSACIARPLLNDATAALHAGGSRTAATAAAMLRHRRGGFVGTLLQPSLGASMRFASTVAATEVAVTRAANAPAMKGIVVPSAVLVKVGDSLWRSFKHKKLLGMDASDLLMALKVDEMFALDFDGVKLSACTITVFKNASLPAGVEEPTPEHEMGDAVVEMKRVKTVGDMAKEVGANGAPLFIRVGLPSATLVYKNNAGHSYRGFPEADVDDPVARVVNAIRAGQCKKSADGGHLVLLPPGLSWPVASNNVLFVRSFYAPLFESVLNRCLPVEPGKDSSLQRRIVTGQPGIGKSVWIARGGM